MSRTQLEVMTGTYRSLLAPTHAQHNATFALTGSRDDGDCGSYALSLLGSALVEDARSIYGKSIASSLQQILTSCFIGSFKQILRCQNCFANRAQVETGIGCDLPISKRHFPPLPN